MTPEQTAVALAVDLALIVTAFALFVRSRWRLCWGFAVYVAVVVPFSLSIVLWPHQFYKAWFWTAGQEVFDAVRMGIALEIAWRVFHQVPGRRTTLLLLGGIAVVMTGARMEGGPLLVMAATLVTARWDRLTLHPFQAAVLTSFAAYQAVFGLMIGICAYDRSMAPLEWQLRQYEPFAYLALVSFWAYVAWRPAPRTIPSGPGTMTAGVGEAQSGHTSESWRMFQRLGFLSASRSQARCPSGA